MAKQTFTTGQVLTAAQLTSLQQTAMLGGAANAKTASYTLVAADAGDAITMSNASATTITVNSGLFSAGDIVTIINLGAGVCTITAGTATVTTSGSLALAINQGGVLRFTSASAAIFFQFATPASGDIEGITTGANSGLTGGVTSGTADLKVNFASKGQLAVGTGSGTTGFLNVGTNGHTLVADSSTSTGLKWAAGGKILQVVYADYSTQVAVTNNTFTDTGLTATITPTASNTKVLILASLNGINISQQGNRMSVRALAGAGVLTTFGDYFGYTAAGGEIVGESISLNFLHTHGTASAITYKLQMMNPANNGVAVRVQQGGNHTSFITLLEVAA